MPLGLLCQHRTLLWHWQATYVGRLCVVVRGSGGTAVQRQPAVRRFPTCVCPAALRLPLLPAGFGLTVGFTEMDSVVVLETTQAVNSFLEKQVRCLGGCGRMKHLVGGVLPPRVGQWQSQLGAGTLLLDNGTRHPPSRVQLGSHDCRPWSQVEMGAGATAALGSHGEALPGNMQARSSGCWLQAVVFSGLGKQALRRRAQREMWCTSQGFDMGLERDHGLHVRDTAQFMFGCVLLGRLSHALGGGPTSDQMDTARMPAAARRHTPGYAAPASNL